MMPDIQEAIKKNLPQEVGDMLKARLEECTANESKNKTLTEKNETLEKRIKALEGEIQKYIGYDNRAKELDTRENAIIKREQEQVVFEANTKLAESEKRAGEMFGFVQMVFKSPVYRKMNILSSSYENNNGMSKTTFGPPHSEEIHVD